MGRFALREAELNNARSSLMRGCLSCILSFVFPLWAPFLFVVRCLQRNGFSATDPFLYLQMYMDVRKKQKEV